MNARARGVIFDLDGTLLHTLDDIADAMRATFAEADLAIPSEAHVRELIGHGMRNLLARASGIDENDARIDELLFFYRADYAERMYDNTRFYDGLPELLDELTKRDVPLAVLSNKSDEFTVAICAHYLSRWPFAFARGAREDVPKKPDPAAALEAASAMGRDPGEITFVGDSAVDIETAQRAGMRSVAVTWGYRDLDELEGAAPDAIVHDADGLLALLLH